MSDVVELQVTYPDAESAATAARVAVAAELAACAQVAQIGSVYLWEGVVQSEPETLVTFKTLDIHLPRLAELLRESHPYDTPQMTALPVVWGTPDYLGWVRDNVKA